MGQLREVAGRVRGREPSEHGREQRARRPADASAMLVVVALLLVVPILEIVVIIAVGEAIGGWPTFLLLLASRCSAPGWSAARAPGLARPRPGAAHAAGCRRASSPTRALVLVGGGAAARARLRHGHRRVLPRPALRPAGRAQPARGGHLAGGSSPQTDERTSNLSGDRAPEAPEWRAREAPAGPRRSPSSDDVVEGEVIDEDDARPRRRGRELRAPRDGTPNGGAGRTREGPAVHGRGGPLQGLWWRVRRCACAARLLAARLAQQRQALLEQLLQLGDGATLQEHVPVGADVLDLLGLGLGAVDRSLASLPQRHSHVGGTSASMENGSSVRWPCGQTYAVMLSLARNDVLVGSPCCSHRGVREAPFCSWGARLGHAGLPPRRVPVSDTAALVSIPVTGRLNESRRLQLFPIASRDCERGLR